MDSTGNGSQPTVVLVHGAWGDATGFDGVIRILHDQATAQSVLRTRCEGYKATRSTSLTC